MSGFLVIFIKIKIIDDMSILKFSDGEEFNTSGPIRKELRRDGWYIIGGGLMIPVESEEAADELIKRLEGDDA